VVGRWNAWLLPALITVAQVCWWPGSVLLRGSAVALVPAAAMVAATLLVGWTLVRRRERPVTVTLVIYGVVTLAYWIVRDEHRAFFAGDAGLPVEFAIWTAVFNLGMHAVWRTAVLVCAGLALLEFAEMAAGEGLTVLGLARASVAMMIYLAIAAFGRRRGRWVRERREAEHRLAAARRAGIEAATAERRRLTRELHDEAAHHLTAIVIDASTAQMLGDEQSQQRDEVLDRTRHTSGTTLATLQNLVEVLPFADMPAPSLTGLADDFRLLGQVVEVDLPVVDPPRPVAEAAYGIARESLTNTLRYAPGGAVRVRLSYDGERAELVVDDDGRQASAPVAAGLGGGNGLTGMRERAQALGGSLEAGPRPDGGWRVRAVLPVPADARRPDAAPSPTAGQRAVKLRRRVALDACLLLLVLALPLSFIVHGVATGSVTAAVAVSLTLVAFAHGAPLLWRRSRPWPAFAAVTLTLPLGLLLEAAGAVAFAYPVILSLFVVELFAVYSLAAWGARPALTWLGIPVTAVSTSVVFGAMEHSEAAFAEYQMPPAFLFVALMALPLLVTPFSLLLIWLAGYLVWRRRDRRRASEEGIEAALARAAELTRVERDRFAAGLRGAVLQHVAEVRAAAAREDLPAVVASARSALAAMRVLLAGAARAGVPTSAAPTPPAAPPPVPQTTAGSSAATN
jgi:signal transduction histidine kinase